MNVAPIIFFEMAAAIIILALALVAVVFYLSRIIKTFHANFNMGNKDFQENANLLDEARAKAVKIIDEANSKALDIANKTNLSSDIASGNFNREITRITSLQIKEFEGITSDFIRTYSQVLQDLETKNIEVFQNISKNIEVNTMKEIKNFKESMQKQTVLSEDLVRKKVDSDYAEARKNIDEYKEKELGKIDDGIYAALEKISKLVLGKALNLSEHEALILKSLEKAKAEGIFEQ